MVIMEIIGIEVVEEDIRIEDEVEEEFMYYEMYFALYVIVVIS